MEVGTVNLLFNLITKGRIFEPFRNSTLSLDNIDKEFVFLNYIGDPLKPKFLLNYEKRPVIVGDFEASKNKGCTFESNSFLYKNFSYLLSTNLNCFFITNGETTIFYYIPRKLRVDEVPEKEGGKKAPKFKVELEYVRIQNFGSYSQNLGRNISLRITNRLLIASIATKNYMNLSKMNETKKINERPLNENIRNVLTKIKKPEKEIQKIINSMRNRLQINDLHFCISKVQSSMNLPQSPEKRLNIIKNFKYQVKITLSERSIVLVTEFGELRRNDLNPLSAHLLPNSQNVVLKIYDYITLKNCFKLTEGKIDQWLLLNDPKNYIDYIFKNLFVNEIICLGKIQLHNLNCNSESIINSPQLYFYGYIRIEEFCGFYLCMEELKFVDQKPTSQSELNQGILELKKLRSLGILHNDVKPSNVCFDKFNEKFYIFDFGISILLQNEEGTDATNTPKYDDFGQEYSEDELLEEDVQNMRTLLDESEKVFMKERKIK